MTRPTPDELHKKALALPNKVRPVDYIDTFRKLRDEKKFSYRQIAAWCKERGVDVSHAQIYRILKKDSG